MLLHYRANNSVTKLQAAVFGLTYYQRIFSPKTMYPRLTTLGINVNIVKWHVR